MKDNIKAVVMYIMAVVIVALCNIAAVILYLAAELIKLGVKLVEATINGVPIAVETVRLFSIKLIKKFVNFFNNLAVIIRGSIMTAGNTICNNAGGIYDYIKDKRHVIANDVKATKKYINFRVDSIKARHGGSNAVAVIKTKQGNVIDCLKDSIHEAIEFRKEVMAECR